MDHMQASREAFSTLDPECLGQPLDEFIPKAIDAGFKDIRPYLEDYEIDTVFRPWRICVGVDVVRLVGVRRSRNKLLVRSLRHG